MDFGSKQITEGKQMYQSKQKVENMQKSFELSNEVSSGIGSSLGYLVCREDSSGSSAGSNTKLCRWSDTRVAKKSRTSFHFKLELSSTWGSNLDTAIPKRTLAALNSGRGAENDGEKENFANCYPTKRRKTI